MISHYKLFLTTNIYFFFLKLFSDVMNRYLFDRILQQFIILMSSSVQMFSYRALLLPRLVQLVRRHCTKYVEHL